jgi:hypothetical protein
MQTFFLVFLACLSTAPEARCQKVEIAWEGSLQQCMLFGQQKIAAWSGEHPGYLPMRGYKCLWGKAV